LRSRVNVAEAEEVVKSAKEVFAIREEGAGILQRVTKESDPLLKYTQSDVDLRSGPPKETGRMPEPRAIFTIGYEKRSIEDLIWILQARGVKCQCIRCREVKDGLIIEPKINITAYPASDGIEYFISADSQDGKVLYGFCRLRLDNNSKIAPAIIRELHVYGQLVSIGNTKKIQHSGLGKKLLAKAERIAKGNELKKIAVISGVGVRGYYRKFGYKLKNNYMVKDI